MFAPSGQPNTSWHDENGHSLRGHQPPRRLGGDGPAGSVSHDNSGESSNFLCSEHWITTTPSFLDTSGSSPSPTALSGLGQDACAASPYLRTAFRAEEGSAGGFESSWHPIQTYESQDWSIPPELRALSRTKLCAPSQAKTLEHNGFQGSHGPVNALPEEGYASSRMDRSNHPAHVRLVHASLSEDSAILDRTAGGRDWSFHSTTPLPKELSIGDTTESAEGIPDDGIEDLLSEIALLGVTRTIE